MRPRHRTRRTPRPWRRRRPGSRAGRRASRAGRGAARRAPRDPRRGPGRRPRKNGTSEPRRTATARRSGSVELGAPRLERAVEGRGSIRRPPARPAATGIRFSRRAASAGAGPGPPGQPRRPRRGSRRWPAARGCRPAGPASKPGHVQGVLAAGGRGQAQPVGERQRHEDGVERVEAVGPDPMTARVRLSFAGARRTTGARRRCGSARRSRSRRRPVPRRGRAASWPMGPSASRRASHSPTARVCGRRSGSMPAAVSAGGDATRVELAAAAPGRCGSSSAARGRRPGRAARAHPRPPGRGGRPSRTARPR